MLIISNLDIVYSYQAMDDYKKLNDKKIYCSKRTDIYNTKHICRTIVSNHNLDIFLMSFPLVNAHNNRYGATVLF